MGIGMVAVVGSDVADRAIRLFSQLGQKAWIIGEVVSAPAGVTLA
jgi:phosphoribosylaminoimidazole (AIR) synthetase